MEVLGWEKEDDDERMEVDVYVDSHRPSGWSRKSTNKTMLTVAGVGVRHWSRTPNARALSGGAAEHNTMLTWFPEALGCSRWPGTWAGRRRSGFGPTAVPRRPVATAEVWASSATWSWRGSGSRALKEGRVKLKTVKEIESVAGH